MKKFQVLTYSISVIAAIILIVNILSNRFFFRIDTTQDKRYTLSKATKTILRDLDKPVTVKAYFTKKLPPQLYQTRQEFRDLLVEYANRSNGMVMYEFSDPSEKEALAEEAQQNGIPPVQVQVRNKDKFEAMVCYMGATIQMGDSPPEVIPQIVEGMPLEYHLTTSIKKVSIINKPKIAFLQGHGEPGRMNLRQILSQLDVLYESDFIQLNDTSDALADYNTLAIIAPTDTFPESHIQQLDQFLAKGNNILVALNRVEADLQNGYGVSVYTGLEDWLERKGINIENAFLIDANCGQVGVVQNMGGFRVQQQIPFPYLPVIQNFNKEHPITKGIQEAIFSFVSPVNFTNDSTLKITPLAFTSNRSGTNNTPVYFNVGKDWDESDFPLKNLVIAASVEGKLSGNNTSRMVLFADGDFAVNRGDGQNMQSLNQDNVNLLTNSIDWLTDETGIIDLRTKEVTSRPIEEMEDGRKAFLKWLNFLLPVIIIIVIGIYRWQMQNVKKINRMQENYVQ